MSEQKVRLKYYEEKMAQSNKIIFGKTFHNHLNLLDGNKLLKGGLIK